MFRVGIRVVIITCCLEVVLTVKMSIVIEWRSNVAINIHDLWLICEGSLLSNAYTAVDWVVENMAGGFTVSFMVRSGARECAIPSTMASTTFVFTFWRF